MSVSFHRKKHAKAETERQEKQDSVSSSPAGCGLLQSKGYLDKLMSNQRKKDDI